MKIIIVSSANGVVFLFFLGGGLGKDAREKSNFY